MVGVQVVQTELSLTEVQFYKTITSVLSRLLVPPSISDSRTNVTVFVNVQTTLPCEATGVPKPTVRWQKNGRSINTEQNQNMYRLIQVFSHA